MENNVKDQSYLHDRQVAADSPIAVALISAAVVFLLVLSIGFARRDRDIFTPALIFAVITLSLIWFGQFGLRIYMIVVAFIERATGIDLPGGMSADELEAFREAIEKVKPNTLRVEHIYKDKDGNTTGGDWVEEDPQLLFDVANALYNTGLPFSVNKMVDEYKIISRGQYDQLTSDTDPKSWIRKGGSEYLEWKNTTKRGLGCRPTEKGETTFRAALAGSPPATRQ